MSVQVDPGPAEQPSKRSKPFCRRDWVLTATLFLLALAIYVRTLAPDLLFGDSGEFQILAITGGLAHAFGYPIYLAIAKIFTYIPYGSLPARVNLLSAVFGAVAVAEVYLICRSLRVRRFFSAIGAFALMISPLYWSQSVIAEVYTISAAFLGSILLCVLLWRTGRNARWLAAAGFLGALCLGIHHVVLLSAPIVVCYLAACRATKLDWKNAAGGIFAGAVLTFCAYMVMGSINSPATASNFLRPVVTEYGLKSPSQLDSPLARAKFAFFADQFRGGFQAEHFQPNIGKVQGEIQEDFGWAIPIFAAAGILAIFAKRRSRKEGLLIVGTFIALLVAPMFLQAFDLDVEFIQSHVLLCVLSALGLQGIQELLLRRSALAPGPGWVAAATAALIYVVGSWSILLGVPPALQAAKPTFLDADRRRFPYPVDEPTAPHDLATAVVSTVPDNSMLLLDWSYFDACYYVALFEQHKPGIQIVAGYPSSPEPPQTLRSIMAFYVESAKTRPLFADRAPAAMDSAFRQSPALQGESSRVYLYSLIPIRRRD